MEKKAKRISKKLKEKIITAGVVLNKGARAGKSALNGMIGDSLQKNVKPLSIRMQFFHNNQILELDKKNLKVTFPDASSGICILIHGLLTDESLFDFPGEKGVNYGSLVQKDFGFTSLYLRYNSGLHISENGNLLSIILDELIKEYPVKVTKIVFIGHSMGGLVIHSALDYAEKNKSGWIKKVKKVFLLGSPHLGAPLEKFSNLASGILKILPVPFTKLSRNILNFRSSGIKDLRFGYTSEDDWAGKNPDAILENNRTGIRLQPGIEYFVITGTISKNPESFLSGWIGDSLVRKPSAHGKSIHKEKSIPFPEENLKEFPGISHMRLAHSKKIYEQLKIWID
ncbi:MAG: alpha/beta hydrolase [Leptospiraceae bacterium]|nr:alpha/beta hydrolase [Leptospiraceae bacterium]